MMAKTFNAFSVQEVKGQLIGEWEALPIPSLAKDEVLVRVDYSSLNYKDALSATGNRGARAITRMYQGSMPPT